MTPITASAPGKIILFGEHAVVYGRPAIAAPVQSVQARAVFEPAPTGSAGGELWISAPLVGLRAHWRAIAAGEEPNRAAAPLAAALEGTLAALGRSDPPAGTLTITSTIPLAAGLGSGAAVSVAVIRVLAAAAGRELPPETVSALAFEVEKLLHGSPSGVDNTVVTYARPVFFRRLAHGGAPQIEMLAVPQPFTIVIGDTGVASPTALAVGDLRRLWQADPLPYERLFDQAGELADAARRLIETGRPLELGALMDANHAVLQGMGVSSPELDRLVKAARRAGALGAKLSGGGRGGNMIALAHPAQAPAVGAALTAAGATRAIITEVKQG